MTGLHHVYHAYVVHDGYHVDVTTEHVRALDRSGLATHLTTNVVNFVHDGWEQATLETLRQLCLDPNLPADDAVLYAHTKGVVVRGVWPDTWRRGMTVGVVDRWRECVDWLGHEGRDAVGCHWLTPERYPGNVTTPFFGGNFWWTTVGYVRRLPPLTYRERHDAERWIGLADPRVHDLAPGWPSWETTLR